MKILVTGSTGTVGSEVIRQAIPDTEISTVFALIRRPLEMKDETLRTIVHPDWVAAGDQTVAMIEVKLKQFGAIMVFFPNHNAYASGNHFDR